MIKSHPGSRIEIWCGDYINDDEDSPRESEDAVDKVDILQIECGTNGDYIVEVVDKEQCVLVEEQKETSDSIFDN